MKKINYLIKLISIFVLLLTIYIALIQLWRLSSPQYPPAGMLDHKTKTGPAEIEDWTSSRRLHD